MPSAPFLIAGVDEVGRGPLAGPVTAAAVILDPHRPVDGLLDSKALDAAERERLDRLVRRRALAYCIAEASVEEIDRLNVLQASLLAMRRAIDGLSLPRDGRGGARPDLVLVDGNHLPGSDLAEADVVKGDARVASISAASIIAKVARDRLMDELHAAFPVYGFDRHKGYPTAEHRAALLRHGPSVLHRTSFGPVREALAVRVPHP